MPYGIAVAGLAGRIRRRLELHADRLDLRVVRVPDRDRLQWLGRDRLHANGFGGTAQLGIPKFSYCISAVGNPTAVGNSTGTPGRWLGSYDANGNDVWGWQWASACLNASAAQPSAAAQPPAGWPTSAGDRYRPPGSHPLCRRHWRLRAANPFRGGWGFARKFAVRRGIDRGAQCAYTLSAWPWGQGWQRTRARARRLGALWTAGMVFPGLHRQCRFRGPGTRVPGRAGGEREDCSPQGRGPDRGDPALLDRPGGQVAHGGPPALAAGDRKLFAAGNQPPGIRVLRGHPITRASTKWLCR